MARGRHRAGLKQEASKGMSEIPRLALITGAAQGIGAAVAQRLAADGRTVALLDVDSEGLAATVRAIEAQGGRALSACVDIADEQAASEAVRAIVDEAGHPSILVNNAGMARDVSLFDMTLDDWDAVQSVHLRASFVFARALAPAMAESGWGRIIQISSISAEGHAGRANYCAAKAGMHGFVKALAVELGPMGITANAVAPGLIVTRMTQATAARRGLSLEEHLADSVTRIPVRRAGHPADIAAAVAYLSSEEAGFVSGQVLYVAGGVMR